MLAFTFNASAQDNSKAVAKAKQDTQEIAQYLNLSGDILNDLETVFTEKHQTLLIEGISEERKVVLSQYVAAKLENMLTKDQLEKLKFDKTLYTKLTK